MPDPEKLSPKNQEKSSEDHHIPEVRVVVRDQYESDKPHRVLPFELKSQQECRLRILWLDGHTKDAIESVVRIEDREVTDDGYVITLSIPDVTNQTAERTMRESNFSSDGMVRWKYTEDGQEMVIEDVGYLLKED